MTNPGGAVDGSTMDAGGGGAAPAFLNLAVAEVVIEAEEDSGALWQGKRG